MDQMNITNTNIFHSKTLENLPKLGYLGLKICHLATLNREAAVQRDQIGPNFTV
jgi:hypothetical protein